MQTKNIKSKSFSQFIAFSFLFLISSLFNLAISNDIPFNNLTLEESNSTSNGYTYNVTTNTTTINSISNISLVGFSHGFILNSGSLIINSPVNFDGCTPGSCEPSPGPTIYINNSILDIANSSLLTNTSPLVLDASVIKIDLTGSVRNINNSGTISGAFAGIENFANDDNSNSTLFVQNITNSGTISGNIVGIYNGLNSGSGSLIKQIVNTSSGHITGVGAGGIYNLGDINLIQNAGAIDSIVNPDSLSYIGEVKNTGQINLIFNSGTIGTLNNYQNNLQINGNLPTNYNIIISSSDYGHLLNSGSINGATHFNIYDGSIITSHLYSSVLQGFTSSNIVTSSGTYDGLHWSLVEEERSPNVWDLLFSGVSTSGTQSSLQSQSGYLRSAMNLQKTAINLGLNYDCTTFDSNGVCVGLGGRYISLDSNSQFNTTNAMVVTSFKLADNFRVGAYLDQNVSNQSKVVSLSNGQAPLGGLFVVLSENDQTHEGYELRLAANYQSKDAQISREMIGISELGSGKTSLDAWGAQAQISYAFKPYDKTLLSSYLGMRYSQIKRAGYIEGSDITTPLTYSELKDESATALAGLKLNIALADDFNVQGHLGIEDDLHQKIGNLTATGIDGLTPIMMSNDKNKFRGVAGLGASLNISKYQVLRGSVNYQQLPYQTSGAVTGMVTYELGL